MVGPPSRGGLWGWSAEPRRTLGLVRLGSADLLDWPGSTDYEPDPDEQLVESCHARRDFRQLALEMSLLQFGPQPFVLPLVKRQVRLVQSALLGSADFSRDQVGDVRHPEGLVQDTQIGLDL